jgi:formiminotetrahydrofolate cyclodeaminase
MYKDESLKKYLDDLAAKLPAPGGGSAAAMTAALGISLISMVANFTVGKPKYAQYENEVRQILEKSEKLRLAFLELVDLDVKAYQSKNIGEALDVPFRICRLTFEAMQLCPALITKGNINLISDVGVAAVFLESAFAAARLNVEINLRSIEDKGFVELTRKELDEKEKSVKELRKDTEVKVGKIIRG